MEWSGYHSLTCSLELPTLSCLKMKEGYRSSRDKRMLLSEKAGQSGISYPQATCPVPAWLSPYGLSEQATTVLLALIKNSCLPLLTLEIRTSTATGPIVRLALFIHSTTSARP